MANTTKKQEGTIEVKPIGSHYVEVEIQGDGDLVLNKMNHRNARMLYEKQTDTHTTRETTNPWEDVATQIHWLNWHPGMYDTKNLTEEDVTKLFETDKPCITGFGIKKSLMDAVVRNEIDKYSTKISNALNVVMDNDLIPIEYASHRVDERLMSPKKGAPVLVRINHFNGWRAKFKVSYTDNVYSLDQIVNIINLAGFGLGIGSGRTSGFGRYHVVGVTAIG